MSGRRRVAAAVALAVLAMSSLAACVGFTGDPTVAPTPDAFANWSDRPLPPDPKLAARILDPIHGCGLGVEGVPLTILLQDRRTDSTAMFLVSNPMVFGTCMTSLNGGTTGEVPNGPGPMSGAISIDDQNQLDGGTGATIFWLAGRVDASATQVLITLTDGRAVVASLGNRYWLAWWPINANAARVAAVDSAGTEIGSLEVPR